ncbi:zinc finger a20 and an1 domain-containing stress-associated protein 5, partial [Phtheirospermum japonicum]
PPPQTIPTPLLPAARSPPETSDTKLPPVACDPKTSLASSPDLVNPVADWGNLKRPREVTRCSESGCRKKVGLMGFRCRCGDVFCSEHRGAGRRDSNRARVDGGLVAEFPTIGFRRLENGSIRR